ncbi:hypothetical protein F2Q68_00029515 [Brassica cretica]|uniref:Uncharacterized protein n=1 Tax=Brassica cretica TaxID=69181 RepID=A0A8S9GA42_BRACR|nr:hypothetical protein F2Q68_00029515 [Brassica cretica]
MPCKMPQRPVMISRGNAPNTTTLVFISCSIHKELEARYLQKRTTLLSASFVSASFVSVSINSPSCGPNSTSLKNTISSALGEETTALPFGFFDIGSPEIDLVEETQVLAEESEWRTALPFGFFDVGSPETALVEETSVLPVCLIGGDLPSGFIADSAS